jgi:hypothetical protein
VRQEPELVQADRDARLVEDAHDDLLAEHGGERRDAQVVGRPSMTTGDAAVLRDALLRDVQVGHDLDAARERRLRLLRHDHAVDQDAVDAVADLEVLAGRLQVDVGALLVDATGDDAVGEPDDGRLRGQLLELLDGQVFVADAVVDLDVVLEVLEGVLDLVAAGLERLADGEEDVLLGGDDRLDLLAGDEADLVGGEDVQRVLHRQPQLGAVDGERDHLVTAGQFLRHQPRDAHLEDVGLGQVDVLDAPVLAQHAHAVALGDEPHRHEQVADLLVPAQLLLLLQGGVELVVGDQPLPHEEFAYSLTLHSAWPAVRLAARPPPARRGAPPRPVCGDSWSSRGHPAGGPRGPAGTATSVLSGAGTAFWRTYRPPAAWYARKAP